MTEPHIEWLSPWAPVLDGEKLVSELHRELCPEHPLNGRRVELLGHRPGGGGGDYLFRLLDGAQQFAIVHLTWTVETDSEYPRTTLFAGIDELQERLRQDNQRRLDSTASAHLSPCCVQTRPSVGGDPDYDHRHAEGQ